MMRGVVYGCAWEAVIALWLAAFVLVWRLA